MALTEQILEKHPNAYSAYSLRLLDRQNSNPLIRIRRDIDDVEVDVYPDANGEVSFNSYIYVTVNQSTATTLGEFTAISGYTDKDSLGTSPNLYASIIYDQSNNAGDYVVQTTSSQPELYSNSKPDINRSPVSQAPALIAKGVSLSSTDTLFKIPGEGQSFLLFSSLGLGTTYGNTYGLITDRSKRTGLFESFYTYNFLTNYFRVDEEGQSSGDPIIDIQKVKLNDSFEYLQSTSGTIIFYRYSDRRDFNYVQIQGTSQVEGVGMYFNTLFTDFICYSTFDASTEYDLNAEFGEHVLGEVQPKSLTTTTSNSFLFNNPDPIAAYSFRDLRDSKNLGNYDTKIVRVRRVIDNIEVDLLAGPTGFVTLDSPVLSTTEYTSDVSSSATYETNANTFGEFVNHSDYTDTDNLGASTTAKVVAWYNQAEEEISDLPLQVASGSAAAYSVRQVNEEYTGPLLTVRRDSDDVEKDIYADANGDLDTQGIEDFVRDGILGEDYNETRLLLDEIPSGESAPPQAAAAYSVRKLRRLYSGPLMRIRRTDGIEVDVYPQSDGWIGRESTIANVTEISGGSGDFTGEYLKLKYFIANTNATVAVWYDQSGLGNDAEQPTPSNQPTIATNGNLIYSNGRPVVHSVNNYFSTGPTINTFECSFILVGKHLSGDNGWLFASTPTGDPSTQFGIRAKASGNLEYFYGNGTSFDSREFGGVSNLNPYVLTQYKRPNQIFTSGNDSIEAVATDAVGTPSELVFDVYSTNGTVYLRGQDDYFQDFIVYNTYERDSRVFANNNANSEYKLYGGWGATVTTWYDQSLGMTSERILDTVYGVGPSFAYSLRVINSFYDIGAGFQPLVDVRRGTGTVTVTVLPDSNGELTEDSRVYGAGFPYGDNHTLKSFAAGLDCYVTKWWDQSVNDPASTSHLVQTDTTKQPQLMSNGELITVNKKAAIKFSAASENYFEPNSFTGSATTEFYTVFKTSDTDFRMHSSTTSDWALFAKQNDTGLVSNSFGTPIYRLNNVVQSFSNKSDAEIALANDEQQLLTIAGDSSTWGDYRFVEEPVGGSQVFFSGTVQELIGYTSDRATALSMSASDIRDIIETNINKYYRIYNINNATQEVTSSQPTVYNSNGIVTENGKPAVQWDVNSKIYSLGGSDSATFEFFAAGSMSSSQAFGVIGHDTNEFGWFGSSSTSTLILGNFGSPTLFVNGTQFAGTRQVDVYNALNQHFLVSSIGGSTTGWEDIKLFRYRDSSGAMEGKVQEVIIYASDQSSNRTNIEKSINLYYNIYPQNAAVQSTSSDQPELYNGFNLITLGGTAALSTNGLSCLWGGYFDRQIGFVFLVSKPYLGSSRWLINLDSDNNPSVNEAGTTSQISGTLKNGIEYAGNFSWNNLFDESLFTFYNIGAQTDPLLKIASRGTGEAPNNPGQALFKEIILYQDTKTTSTESIGNDINRAYSIYNYNTRKLLLDIIPLATNAYSIRQLTQQYTGPLFKIIDSGNSKDVSADYWGNPNLSEISDGTYDMTHWYDQANPGEFVQADTSYPTITIANGVITGITVTSTAKFNYTGGGGTITGLNEIDTKLSGNNEVIAVHGGQIQDTIDIFPASGSTTEIREIIYYKDGFNR